MLGIDVLIKQEINFLKGRRIGLITNQTGCNHKLRPTIDLLYEHPDVKLVALFSPEHGLRGMISAGQHVAASHDTHTGLPVYSLYGKTRRPTDKMLRGLDTLVFDIQDIGVRWYTYISTMALAMEEAGKRKIEFIVLDRPNPLGGLKIEGPILDTRLKSFVGMYRVPVVHGMTVGELAKFYQGEQKLPVKLRVVRMEGWERRMVWNDTGLTWVPTSPWIPASQTTLLYPGMGLIGETGLVSIGIGTCLPFEIAGAPWMSSYTVAGKLNEKHLPGVIFRPFFFEPFFGKFHGKKCGGVHIHVVDNHKFMPLTTALYLLETIREVYPQRFTSSFTRERKKSFDKHLGTGKISLALERGEIIDTVLEGWKRNIKKFREKRKKYLLY